MDEPYKNWVIDLEKKTATDDNGLIILFREEKPGTLEGEIQNPDEMENENDAIPLIQDAARALLTEMKRVRDSAN